MNFNNKDMKNYSIKGTEKQINYMTSLLNEILEGPATYVAQTEARGLVGLPVEHVKYYCLLQGLVWGIEQIREFDAPTGIKAIKDYQKGCIGVQELVYRLTNQL